MKTSTAQLVPTGGPPVPQTLRQHLRGIFVRHTEEILAEVAPTLRRLRTLLLVLAISIPVFFAGLLVTIWHLAR